MPKAALNRNARKARSEIAVAAREGRPDADIDALRLEYREAVAESMIEAGVAELVRVREIVNSAPPLTSELIEQIRGLLRPTPASNTGDAA